MLVQVKLCTVQFQSKIAIYNIRNVSAVMSIDVGSSEITHCTISIKDSYNIRNASAVMSIGIGPSEITHYALYNFN